MKAPSDKMEVRAVRVMNLINSNVTVHLASLELTVKRQSVSNVVQTLLFVFYKALTSYDAI